MELINLSASSEKHELPFALGGGNFDWLGFSRTQYFLHEEHFLQNQSQLCLLCVSSNNRNTLGIKDNFLENALVKRWVSSQIRQ